MRLILLTSVALTLAGCERNDSETQAALVQNAIANAEAIAANIATEAAEAEKAKASPVAAAPGKRDDWVGTWNGVEGTQLIIERDGAPDRYRLTNHWGLDDESSGVYIGHSSANGIVFSRDGANLQLTAGDGEATGMKWLDGKKDCLIVAEGEGYCRD